MQYSKQNEKVIQQYIIFFKREEEEDFDILYMIALVYYFSIDYLNSC